MRIFASLLLLSFVLMACSEVESSSEKHDVPPPAVLVTPVIERLVSSGESMVARTRAVHQVALRARVSGLLEKRLFNAGEQVEKGQLLFVIESEQYQANVAAAVAETAEAQAIYQRAQQYLTRLQSVVRGGVSATDLDTARNDVQTAKARLAQARARQDSANLQLAYTEIYAPITGRISEAKIDTGNLIGPDSGVLVTITQLDPIYVDFTISERESTRFMRNRRELNQGQADVEDYLLRLRLSDGSLYEQAGQLDYVANEVDRATGTLAMRAVIENPKGMLRPGQFVTALVSDTTPNKALVIPQSAVQQDKEGYHVLVVNANGEVLRRRVMLGDRSQIDWIVTSGLQAGESVIFEGLQKVQAGMKVEAVSGDPRAGLTTEFGS